MKKNHHRIALLVCPLFATVLLGSCVVPVHSGDGRYASSSGSFGVYNTLPSSFVGGAYYHDGRYYSGGNHQTGRYTHAGRSYTSRYYYNGKYIYGGNYKQYNTTSRRSGSYDSASRQANHDSGHRTETRPSYSRRIHRR